MPELRKDPIVDRWIVIAPDRANRPMELPDLTDNSATLFDPFAEGNEASTPPEIFAFRNHGSLANKPGWRVRVIPNKFPALQMEGALDWSSDGPYESMNGLGTHEVIIECPHDESSLSRLPVENICEVLSTYRSRIMELKQDRRLAHALIFKNKGILAGASLRHSHSQLIATPVVPIAIREEINGSRAFFDDRGRSVFDELIRHELDFGSRIVLDTPGYVALCPYASRFPYETWILPKQHLSHYENLEPQGINELSPVLKTVLQKLEIALEDPPYNYVLHSAPFSQPKLPHFCWHFEIFPRLTRVAGFEWGSGFYINHVPPEEAAKALRDAMAMV